ncbi:hypothetical protein F2Q70_00005106 [Brassica cretica]|uniref:Uncharacterized protein n=1 Tax=Brassica cretica TaxID=69181 RepID=A0A8S9J014_BRACR|nr:hypothetical protein F2Q68_00021765 [Brassica cretica]KAF2574963.1 hypothetical protein F2Q70_00005106 [Brassica cretica]
MHCGICGQPDHNSRFHSKKQASGAGPSHVASPTASQAPSPAASQASSQGGCHIIHGYEDMC